MNCQKCKSNCNELIRQDKKFCEDCKCSYLYHYNYELFDKISPKLENMCNINKNMHKSLEDTFKLAKTFGVTWLPIGIQPSEVDRFIKYFPVKSEIRDLMILKSIDRFIEIQYQIPLQDRSKNQLIFIANDISKDKCDNFFTERQEGNIDVGRLDHLDKPEGKMCDDCSEIISFGEMCVLLPKQFEKEYMVWHPNCFKCVQCQHVLIDYLFCWDKRNDNGPYCVRHFDDLFFPRCGSCDELIFEETYASVLNESFHIDHLRCFICNEELSQKKFLLESDKTQDLKLWKCVTCLNMSQEDLCYICHESLKEPVNSILTKDGFRAHKRCLSCNICFQSICLSDPDSFVKEESNLIFCVNCYSTKKFVQCQHCREVIDLNDKSNVINGKFIWHDHCIKCSICNKNLREGDEFSVIDVNGKVSRVKKPTIDNAGAICKQCFFDKYEDKCQICEKLIDCDGVNYQSKLFHKQCFQCYKCGCQLEIEKFMTKENNFYCTICYSNLYCNTCSGCKSPIFATENRNKMIAFETRYWHETCFNCYTCNKSVMESGFLFDDDVINCLDCAVK